MTEAKNRQIILVSRPHGDPKPENFKLAEAPVPAIGPGQVLLKTSFLSLDPYMRGRMSDAKSYVPPFAIGEPLGGQTVSKVIASNNLEFATGDMALAFGSWQDYSVSNGGDLRKLDPSGAPVSTALGINLGSHKGKAVRQAIRKAGARLLFLPPYSPDLNPIEQAFAKIKHWMRCAQKRTVEDACAYIGALVATITPLECKNYFQNDGYGSVKA